MKHFLILTISICLNLVEGWDKEKPDCKIKYEVNTTQEAMCCQSLGEGNEKLCQSNQTCIIKDLDGGGEAVTTSKHCR